MRRSDFYFPLNDADVMRCDTVFMKTPQSDPTSEYGQTTRVFPFNCAAGAYCQCWFAAEHGCLKTFCSAESQGSWPLESVCSVCRKDPNVASELIQAFMKIQ